MKTIIPTLFFMLLFASCQTVKKYDLIIENAKILDTKSGKIDANQNLLISNGIIKKISNKNNQKANY